MSGTRSGGKKAAALIKERYGKDFYKRMGKLGGQQSHGGGFKDHERAVEAGRRGGLRSRRGGKNA